MTRLSLRRQRGHNRAGIRYAALPLILIAALSLVTFEFSGAVATSLSAVDQWTSRLEALDPARPMDYFELAEEVADQADDDEQRELARHLFALAGALDANRLGRSAALALADMEHDQTAKRRLLALATLLDAHRSRTSGLSLHQQPSTESVLTLCEALSLYRTGRGPQALSAVEQNNAMQLLQQYGHLLPGGYNQFQQDCRIYRNNLAPTLSDGELARLLRLEAALLAASQRSWSSDLLITGSAPLIEVDPQRIADALRVDVTRSVYRDGGWTRPLN